MNKSQKSGTKYVSSVNTNRTMSYYVTMLQQDLSSSWDRRPWPQ